MDPGTDAPTEGDATRLVPILMHGEEIQGEDRGWKITLEAVVVVEEFEMNGSIELLGRRIERKSS